MVHLESSSGIDIGDNKLNNLDQMDSRYHKGLVGLLILISTFSGCEEKPLVHDACGIENPTENISWLNNIISNFENNPTYDLKSIDLYRDQSNDIILILWQCIGISDTPTGGIYNCQGESLYSCGGIQQYDSCNYFLSKCEYVANLWKKE